MNNEEIQALMKKLQDSGLTPEDIADGILWPLFRDGKMSKEDLKTLCSSIGLELDEEFDKDEGPKDDDANPAPADDNAPETEVTQEQAEDLKEIKPGESKEEFEDKVEDVAEGGDDDNAPADEEPGDKPGDDDGGWDEARKLFKL